MTIPAEGVERWTLPTLSAAIAWCHQRNREGICCILDVLGEYTADSRQIAETEREYQSCIEAVRREGIEASVTLKLTALGVTDAPDRARAIALGLAQECAAAHIGIEIDMEARGLVDTTLDIAHSCLRKGFPVTIALQAYLRRTPGDLRVLLSARGRSRIVKGAYFGDSEDQAVIRAWFCSLVDAAVAGKQGCSIGTHDPVLIDQITRSHADEKGKIEFSFLKGLADATKHSLVLQGWRVSEYVPFGTHIAPYIARRERYLRDLERLGLHPVP